MPAVFALALAAFSFAACKETPAASNVADSSTCQRYIEGFRYDTAVGQCVSFAGTSCGAGVFATLAACKTVHPAQDADAEGRGNDAESGSTETAAARPLNLEPSGGCTRDRNPWNNPSSCQCPTTYSYSPVTGQCHQGDRG